LRIGIGFLNPKHSNHYLYQTHHIFIYLICSSFPGRNFRWNQLLDRSISLSPLYQHLTKRFARQYRYDPPSEFLLTSTYAGIVRDLSGSNKYAKIEMINHPMNVHFETANPKSILNFTFITHWNNTVLYTVYTRKLVRLLGPCYKTGRSKENQDNNYLLSFRIKK